MLQDVFLFSGRLKDNIRLDEESISDEKVREAPGMSMPTGS